MPSGEQDWPVFLTGCHRAGTTLVRFLLDSHPRIACPPESKFLCGLYEFAEYPQVMAALDSLHWQPAEVLAEIGHFARRFLDGYAARQRKARWVDKTPNYCRILPFLDDIFQGQVLYLFLVRHPLDTICSLQEFFRLAGTGFSDPDIARAVERYGAGYRCWARHWCDVYEAIDVFAAARPERSHIFHYEDLVRRPRETVGELFTFLGEEYEEDLLARAFHTPHDVGYEDPKIRQTCQIHASSVGRWKGWDRGLSESLWRVVEPAAVRFGYSLEAEGG